MPVTQATPATTVRGGTSEVPANLRFAHRGRLPRPSDCVSRQKVDLANRCLLPEKTLSCDGPLADELNACWVELATGDIYTMYVLPCMPDGWRSCTESEKSLIDGIGPNCN